MPAPVFVGDEVSAAGWRLAGVRVIIPEAGSEAVALARVMAEGAELVLLSAVCARALPPELLGRFLVSGRPLTLVVPDAQGQGSGEDLTARVRRRLGMQA
ncbi:MAG: Vacuolar H+transporting two-sector ATPase F subunit [Magnetococcales bacterium]|nr:Vacuolar H+transporting two-sector ATPase F subunit [Magnetococcales bacterium]